MLSPAIHVLTADRWTPFIETFRFTGVDLTAAIFAMHVRAQDDAPGSPLMSFGMAASATADGFWLTSVDDLGATPVSIVTLRAASLTALPAAAEPGDDAVLSYDIHVTAPLSDKAVWLAGPFILRSGATQ